MTPGRLEIYGQSANCRCNRSIRKPLERLEPVKDRCNRDGSLYRVSRYYISDDLLYPFPFRFTLLFSVVVGLTRSPHGTPTTPIIHCENPCKPFVRFPRPLATVCTCTHISRVVLQRADSLSLVVSVTTVHLSRSRVYIRYNSSVQRFHQRSLRAHGREISSRFYLSAGSHGAHMCNLLFRLRSLRYALARPRFVGVNKYIYTFRCSRAVLNLTRSRGEERR